MGALRWRNDPLRDTWVGKRQQKGKSAKLGRDSYKRVKVVTPPKRTKKRPF